MTDTPREIWATEVNSKADSGKTREFIATCAKAKVNEWRTHYILASELAKAYEAIRDIARAVETHDEKMALKIMDKHAAIIATAREQGK